MIDFQKWLTMLCILMSGWGVNFLLVIATPLIISAGLASSYDPLQMMAGGQLFSFTGILPALPVAAVLLVLPRVLFGQYKASESYY
jgi:hypothetical protein